ncbi:hypothetical protein [Campylobacter curvus]|uniref:hypothetical protein n=1 Tax=Campylobacter curvus TaxID=200 RepID=UPI00146FF5E6|nr:hypothetical protein [Campylobacter curvus]
MARLLAVPWRIVSDERVSDEARILFLHIAKIADDDEDDICHASDEELASAMGVDSIKKPFEELKKARYMIVDETSEGRSLRLRYDVALDFLGAAGYHEAVKG